jgi:hypothetical protein
LPARRPRPGGAELSRYIYKTAISSARLLSQDDHTVTFSYREAGTGEARTCTLTGEEFLRRFLQHVLPKGFHRVRYVGWLSPAAKGHFQQVAALLDAPPPPPRPAGPHRVELLCPHCQQPLRRIGSFGRAPPP